MLRRILAPPLTRVSVVRSIAIDATTSLASRASARLPPDCDQPTRDQNGRRSAAASYWSDAGEHPHQRRRKEPKAHTEPNANRSLMVVASHRPARGPKIDQGYPNMRSRRPGRLALTAVVSIERFPIDVDEDNRLMPGRASHL